MLEINANKTASAFPSPTAYYSHYLLAARKIITCKEHYEGDYNIFLCGQQQHLEIFLQWCEITDELLKVSPAVCVQI